MSQNIPINIPTFINSPDYSPARVLPRLFFYNGMIECQPWYFQFKTGPFVTDAQINAFPYFDHYNVVTGSFPTTGSLSLLFNNELAAYGTSPNENLYTTYYETYVELLYNPKTRLLNCSAIIPLAEYVKMELNDICNFKGNYYHLRAINDYSLKDGTCNLQLLGPIIPDALRVPRVYSIGELALGGIVAYIDGGGTIGTSGFVAALTDQNATKWGCKGTNITGLSDDGKSNTFQILTQCAERPIAASTTQGTINGYSDWYLPSASELQTMWLNIGRGASGANYNIGNFAAVIYLTSNQWTAGTVPENQCAAQYMDDTGTALAIDKNSPSRIRPIRRFNSQ